MSEVTEVVRERAAASIREEMRRAAQGLAPICGRCGKPIPGGAMFVFRCTECGVAFDRECAEYHFAENGDDRRAYLLGIIEELRAEVARMETET